MATSGTKVTISGSNHLKFIWNRTSTVAGANISSIIKYQLVFVPGSYFTQIAAPIPTYTIVIDGQTITGTATIGNVAAGENKILAEGYATINHSNKGSARSFSFSYEQQLQSLGVLKGSGTGELDAVPAPAYFVAAPNFNSSYNPTISYFGGNMVSELKAAITDSSGQVYYAEYRDIPMNTTGSYQFVLTDQERQNIVSAASGGSASIKFVLKSKIDETFYVKSAARTVTIADSVLTINPRVSETNSKTLVLTGSLDILILGYSTAGFSINAETTNGATIVRQSVKCGDTTISAATGNFTNVESNIFEFVAEDSRGNVATSTITMPVVPYIPVTCNQNVRLNMDGTATLDISGNYFNESFGSQTNSLTVEIRHREDGGAWSAWTDISVLISDISNNTYKLNGTVSGYDPSGTYEFQSRATDKLKTAYSGDSSIVLKPVFDWGRNDFNFNVPIAIEGNPLNDYVIETGTAAMGSNGTWYWSKWKSGRAECYGCRNYGNMDVSTAWGSLFRSETFTQSLPSGLFANTPEVIEVTLRNSNFGGFIAKHEASAPSADNSGAFIVVRPAGATMSQVYISFNIIGRWE